VVVKYIGGSASEWEVHGRGSLAEDNPDYDDDADVVAIIHMRELEKKMPYYCGVRPHTLSSLNRNGISWYAFPRPRLKKVGTRNTVVIDPNTPLPCRYHSRNFNADENRDYINNIEERLSDDPPLLWTGMDSDELRIINGHKRTWAAVVHGLESMPARVVYTNDYDAIKGWIRKHLGGYDEEQRNEAERRIQNDWGEQTEELIKNV